MDEKILILGAGIYQVPLIKKCKALGKKVAVASIPGNYPGFQFADKCFFVDTTDCEGVLKIVEQEHIDGILTTGTDVAVKTIGFVNSRTGFQGISAETAEVVCNKALMKECFLNSNVRTGLFQVAKSLTDAEEISSELGFPLVYKCVDSSGSRGVTIVKNYSQIEKAFHYAMRNTKKDYIIIEQFIDGYEIGIDGYIGNSIKEAFIVPHDKIIFNSGVSNVPIGHIFPIKCNELVRKDIFEQARKVLDGLGINHCFFNMDAIISGNQCFILEIGARCGATCIPELISINYDIDYYEKMIDNALGRDISFPESYSVACGGKLLLSDISGIIKGIRCTDALRNKCVDEVVIDYDIGDRVKAFQVGPDRIGHIIIHDSNRDQILEKLREAENGISILVE